MIDTTVPYSDGWWLQRLSNQLREQAVHCEELQQRYEGNSPLPFVSSLQQAAVRWFVEKSRTNFERLIVSSVLSRLRISGLRTSVDNDEGGDAEAFDQWKRARMKLVTLDAHKMMLAMSRSYIVVGKDSGGRPLATAEDPRFVTAITDPADPYHVLAALKLCHDDVNDRDEAYLYLPGRVAVATRDRKSTGLRNSVGFSAVSFAWDEERSVDIPELQAKGATEDLPALPALAPIAPFFNEDGMAEFEPFLNVIDRINQQILQRMTIATVQAFKQRAFKGLPTSDPKTGAKIDWNDILVADPGSVWNIPASIEIWESGQVDFSGILLAIRDDVKDLAATSGTPLYSVTPDVANGSAEGASLQREMNVFKVESRMDRTEPSHELASELLFRMAGDERRADPGAVQIIWAPVQRYSLAERASAISLTKGVIPRYQQLTEIWGMDPSQADRAMSELTDDMVFAQQMNSSDPTVPIAADPSASPPATLTQKATAFGVLIRSGVTPESAAAQTELSGVKMIPDFVPVTIKDATPEPRVN